VRVRTSGFRLGERLLWFDAHRVLAAPVTAPSSSVASGRIREIRIVFEPRGGKQRELFGAVGFKTLWLIILQGQVVKTPAAIVRLIRAAIEAGLDLDCAACSSAKLTRRGHARAGFCDWGLARPVPGRAGTGCRLCRVTPCGQSSDVSSSLAPASCLACSTRRLPAQQNGERQRDRSWGG